MAEAITIACPECDKKITVAAEAAGKKIRCKGCEHIFVVKAPAAQKAATKPKGKAAPAKAPAAMPDKVKPAKPKAGDDDEEDNNPYGVTSLDTAPRCPNCANELESEEAVICLTCGYNTRTRIRTETRAVEDVTGGTWFLWLLPGILCVLGILVLLTFDIWYTMKINGLVEDSWFEFVGHPSIKIWLWIGSIGFMFVLGRFAVIRLILHPRPPEKVKKKAKEEEED